MLVMVSILLTLHTKRLINLYTIFTRRLKGLNHLVQHNKQHRRKVLLRSFHLIMTGLTSGFCLKNAPEVIWSFVSVVIITSYQGP